MKRRHRKFRGQAIGVDYETLRGHKASGVKKVGLERKKMTNKGGAMSRCLLNMEEGMRVGYIAKRLVCVCAQLLEVP